MIKQCSCFQPISSVQIKQNTIFKCDRFGRWTNLYALNLWDLWFWKLDLMILFKTITEGEHMYRRGLGPFVTKHLGQRNEQLLTWMFCPDRIPSESWLHLWIDKREKTKENSYVFQKRPSQSPVGVTQVTILKITCWCSLHIHSPLVNNAHVHVSDFVHNQVLMTLPEVKFPWLSTKI